MDRRDFLKTIAITSLPIQFTRIGRKSSEAYIHTVTGDFWHVGDPVTWAFEHTSSPILERAKTGLQRLSSVDAEQVIRLITRRCNLNVIDLGQKQVLVEYWAKDGLADLLPFFKKQEFAYPEVDVFLIDRKRNTITIKAGVDFLYGEQLPPAWPVPIFFSKWQRRYQPERDDWIAAPNTWSGFVWEDIEPNRIPWAALKSAWRRGIPFVCPNCDEPTVLVNFGWVQSSLCNFTPRFLYVCWWCRRLFTSHTSGDVLQWIVANLDSDVWPDSRLICNYAVQWETGMRRSIERLE